MTGSPVCMGDRQDISNYSEPTLHLPVAGRAPGERTWERRDWRRSRRELPGWDLPFLLQQTDFIQASGPGFFSLKSVQQRVPEPKEQPMIPRQEHPHCPVFSSSAELRPAALSPSSCDVSLWMTLYSFIPGGQDDLSGRWMLLQKMSVWETDGWLQHLVEAGTWLCLRNRYYLPGNCWEREHTPLY